MQSRKDHSLLFTALWGFCAAAAPSYAAGINRSRPNVVILDAGDIGETKNVAAAQPERVAKMKLLFERLTTDGRSTAGAPQKNDVEVRRFPQSASPAKKAAKSTGKRPNLLFCVADDWQWPHAGAYGDSVVQTPAFDRLAREGVLFANAFVTAPSCTPSRNSILTGQWHWRLGQGLHLWSTLHPKHPVFPLLLEEAGYFVGHCRKAWGPGDFRALGRDRDPAGPVFRDLADFLSQRPDDRPFCFWLGASDPHRPYDWRSGATSGIEIQRIRLPADLPDHEIVRHDVADYYFEVQRWDRDVAAALAVLERAGELENTIVAMTGDNGMPFPRHKCHLYDSGTHAPLAIRWGARVPGGRTVEDFVSLADLAPTFLEAAGAAIPEPMTGRSLLKVLLSDKSGQIDPTRDHVLTGRERHGLAQEFPETGGYPMRAIRTHDFLYIRNFQPDRWPAGAPRNSTYGKIYSDCDDSPSKTFLLEHRDDPQYARYFPLAFAKRPGEELYDLKTDPDQLSNVADQPRWTTIKAELSRRLMAELKATSDPRLIGGAERIDRYAYYGQLKERPDAPGLAGRMNNITPDPDWEKQADEQARQDRTAIIFDGRSPNQLACDTALRCMPDGSWVMVMLGGGDKEPDPHNQVLLTRSHDEGKTWAPMRPLDFGFPRGGNTAAMVPSELMVRGGKCTLIFATHDGRFGGWKEWMTVSNDSGRTWSQPAPAPGRLHDRTFIRNHIVTRDGRILLPFQHYLDGPGPLNPRNGVLMSTDGGSSWTEHGDIRVSSNDRYRGWAENNIVELTDGRIAMIIRADRLGGILDYAESADGGRTWPEFARKSSIPNPGSKATLYPLGGHAVALLHNPNPKHRSPLALWVSFDGMRTWPYQRVLVPESCDGPQGRLNYPDGFVSADKHWLHFAFDDNRHRAVYVGARLPQLPH